VSVPLCTSVYLFACLFVHVFVRTCEAVCIFVWERERVCVYEVVCVGAFVCMYARV
jgi:hypothetical protein